MKKLGIYARVSTDEQKKKGLSTHDQVVRGIELAQSLDVPYEIFKDEGISGSLAIEDRKQMDKLYKKLNDGSIDGIFVTDIDRLARNTEQAAILKKVFKKKKIEVYTVTGKMELENENEELLYDLRSLFGEFENKKTSTRIKRQLERSAIEGKRPGGPLLSYGYTADANKLLIIEEKEAEVIRMIYKLSLEGKGTRQIAGILHKLEIPTKRSIAEKGYLTIRGNRKTAFTWADGTVYGILTNPIYKGERRFKDLTVKSPIIVEPEIFDLVQKSLREKSRFVNTTNKYNYLLKGLIQCSCGHLFYGHKRANGNDNTYVCGSNRQRGGFCGTKGINIPFMEKLVLKQIATLPEQVDKYFELYEERNGTDAIKKQIIEIDSAISKIDMRIGNLIDMKADGDISPTKFKETNIRYNRELNELHQKKAELIPQLDILKNRNKIKAIVSQHVKTLEKYRISFEDKQDIVRALVDKISIVWNPTSKVPFASSMGNLFNKPIHWISISYKIDALTEVKMSKNITLGYSKAGGSYRNSEILKAELKINLETFEIAKEEKQSIRESQVCKLSIA